MRFLSACPNIRKQPPGFVVTTSWWWKILLLGLSLRKVTIDLKHRQIEVTSRYLWFLTFHKSFEFSGVEAITYGYRDTAIHSPFASTYETSDCFTVGLRLIDGDEAALFDFTGEGSFIDNSFLGDWWSNRRVLFDLVGSQESESRAFAELLSNLLNVSIIPPQY